MSQTKQINSRAVFEDVRAVVVETMGMENLAAEILPSTELLYNLPKFDSLAVIELIAALQRRLITIDHYEVNEEIFATFGDLGLFIEGKLS
jgi:acyl carrier protein